MNIWNVQSKESLKKATPGEIRNILLGNRGIVTDADREEFLHPTNPIDIAVSQTGIERDELHAALTRIKKAVEDKESVVVYCDYDADGVTSGSILWEALYTLGAHVMPYIPHRVEEGYGLSVKGIDTVRDSYHPALLITIDHGITGAEQVAYAKSLGMDVIVCDHHVKPSVVPKAITVHTTTLCAAGIAWFVARELLKKSHMDALVDLLPLAAIGTVADMMPLVGVNRSLVTYGMKEMTRTKRPGFVCLVEEAGLDKTAIKSTDISHILAPRLNAAGRIEHAIDALRLLCTKDAARASDLARKLGSINKERQQLTIDTTVHALEMVEDAKTTDGPIILAAHESYNQGIIGLVAGKLVERYWKPSIVVSIGESVSKASARSIPGFNIIEALRQCQDELLEVGGHPMAAGFTLETNKIPAFTQKFSALAREQLGSAQPQRSILVDTILPLSSVTDSVWTMVDSLAPFGIGNPEPVFVSRAVRTTDIRVIGQNQKHLKGFVRSGESGPSFPMVAFGFASKKEVFESSGPVDIAYTIDMNTWNSHTSLQLKLRDIQPHKGTNSSK